MSGALPSTIEGLALVHEDERIIVVEKPPGLLSQPGRTVRDSVVERVRAARPQACGPLMMHRLDMDTSGLLVLAKDPDAHRALGRQFERRTVGKAYLARLERPPPGLGGRISLPLARHSPSDPRQVVDLARGRPSVTLWQLLGPASSAAQERGRPGAATVRLFPLSGRTHQLRVHAADPRGLAAPIVGDRLYGEAGERLLLHAERLVIAHPDDGRRLVFESRAPFA